MKDFFEDLLKYNFIENEKIISFFEINEGKISKKAEVLFSHLVGAQNIWNHRILNNPPMFGIWEPFPLSELKLLNNNNLETSRNILENDVLERVIEYKNSKGKIFENSLKHIIFHYINHSTYHRAKIANEIKNSGLEAISSDYIFYKRQP